MFIIGLILIYLGSKLIYQNYLFRNNGVYSVATDLKKTYESKSGDTYEFVFITEEGNKFSGEYFKPIYEKDIIITDYYVVYVPSNPAISKLLVDKECCENLERILYKRISKADVAILDII